MITIVNDEANHDNAWHKHHHISFGALGPLAKFLHKIFTMCSSCDLWALWVFFLLLVSVTVSRGTAWLLLVDQWPPSQPLRYIFSWKSMSPMIWQANLALCWRRKMLASSKTQTIKQRATLLIASNARITRITAILSQHIESMKYRIHKNISCKAFYLIFKNVPSKYIIIYDYMLSVLPPGLYCYIYVSQCPTYPPTHASWLYMSHSLVRMYIINTLTASTTYCG